jgi:hypothetical protein
VRANSPEGSKEHIENIEALARNQLHMVADTARLYFYSQSPALS